MIANGLGIAGCISPINSHMAWVRHTPSTTIKYTVAGVMAQSALTAAALGEFGHRGDIQVLDDADYGFRAMINTKRWEPAAITAELGSKWLFVSENSFKPYPHCRVLHSVFDVLIGLLETHDIQPREIENIKVFGEAFVELPIWLNNRIEHVQDAQFSLKHGIALAAQRVPPGKAWQDPSLVHSPEVMNLMERVTHHAHPDYVRLLKENRASRPARVEVTARGQTFIGESRYPKGSPSPDPASYMTDDELIAKFLHNAESVLSVQAAQEIVATIMSLESASNIARLMGLLTPGAPLRKVS